MFPPARDMNVPAQCRVRNVAPATVYRTRGLVIGRAKLWSLSCGCDGVLVTSGILEVQ